MWLLIDFFIGNVIGFLFDLFFNGYHIGSFYCFFYWNLHCFLDFYWIFNVYILLYFMLAFLLIVLMFLFDCCYNFNWFCYRIIIVFCVLLVLLDVALNVPLDLLFVFFFDILNWFALDVRQNIFY